MPNDRKTLEEEAVAEQIAVAYRIVTEMARQAPVSEQVQAAVINAVALRYHSYDLIHAWDEA